MAALAWINRRRRRGGARNPRRQSPVGGPGCRKSSGNLQSGSARARLDLLSYVCPGLGGSPVLLLRPYICGCAAAWAYRVCVDLLLLCECARYAKTFAPLSEGPHDHQMVRCPARPRVHPEVAFSVRHGGLLQHHVLTRRCTLSRKDVLPRCGSGNRTCSVL